MGYTVARGNCGRKRDGAESPVVGNAREVNRSIRVWGWEQLREGRTSLAIELPLSHCRHFQKLRNCEFLAHY